LEETARIPERWFGRTPPNKEKSRAGHKPAPQENRRKNVIYRRN
jgi:hypothetical protein